jgi:hypothetical protein
MIVKDIPAALGLLTVAVVLVAIGPLFALWGWNQLFGTYHTFEYTFWNWLAVLAISGVFKTPAISNRK